MTWTWAEIVLGCLGNAVHLEQVIQRNDLVSEAFARLQRVTCIHFQRIAAHSHPACWGDSGKATRIPRAPQVHIPRICIRHSGCSSACKKSCWESFVRPCRKRRRIAKCDCLSLSRAIVDSRTISPPPPNPPHSAKNLNWSLTRGPQSFPEMLSGRYMKAMKLGVRRQPDGQHADP